mmetsp:Transcript_16735/g.54711  ORF Transcript_16735/g.54711 Transcript_16735/m.54711 type:complete len:347 (-) Transcript_16735:318-1358(-)
MGDAAPPAASSGSYLAADLTKNRSGLNTPPAPSNNAAAVVATSTPEPGAEPHALLFSSHGTGEMTPWNGTRTGSGSEKSSPREPDSREGSAPATEAMLAPSEAEGEGEEEAQGKALAGPSGKEAHAMEVEEDAAAMEAAATLAAPSSLWLQDRLALARSALEALAEKTMEAAGGGREAEEERRAEAETGRRRAELRREAGSTLALAGMLPYPERLAAAAERSAGAGFASHKLVQALRMAPTWERNRCGASLERRSLELSLAEARELARAKALGVFGEVPPAATAIAEREEQQTTTTTEVTDAGAAVSTPRVAPRPPAHGATSHPSPAKRARIERAADENAAAAVHR